MKSTFKLILTKDYQLQCLVIDPNNQETIIHLSNNDGDQYIPCICITNNHFSVCQNNEQSTHFIKEWFDTPNEFKTYHFTFQEKEYNILPEVLFSLIINEFKKKAEKQFIIDEIVVEIPSDSNKLYQRIKTSLESIGFENIEITMNKETNYMN